MCWVTDVPHNAYNTGDLPDLPTPTLRFFGLDWDAPAPAGRLFEPPPVGQPCFCGCPNPITANDSGVMMPDVSVPVDRRKQPKQWAVYRRSCFLKLIGVPPADNSPDTIEAPALPTTPASKRGHPQPHISWTTTGRPGPARTISTAAPPLLAQRLQEAGAPQNIVKPAHDGVYHQAATGKAACAADLHLAGRDDLAERIMNGDFG